VLSLSVTGSGAVPVSVVTSPKPRHSSQVRSFDSDSGLSLWCHAPPARQAGLPALPAEP
jgi:hypothetical protein